MSISAHPTTATVEQSENRTLVVSLSLSGEDITLSPYNTTARLTSEETTGEPRPLREIVRGGELRCPVTADWEFGDAVTLEINENGGESVTKDLTDAVRVLNPDAATDELRAAVASLLVAEE